MNPFTPSNYALVFVAVTTAFIAIFHPCCAKSVTSRTSTDLLDTRRCDLALHQEAVHHDLKNRQKSVVVFSKKPSIYFCRNADRKSLAHFKAFVARIQAKNATSYVLKSTVCEDFVDDLVKFVKRCVRFRK